MIFLAGLPSIYYQDILKSVVKAVSDEPITGLSIATKPRLTKKYAEDCIDTMRRYHVGRSNCFEAGLTIIAICEAGEDSSDFCFQFFPFSLLKEVKFVRNFSAAPTQSKKDKNELTLRVLDEVKRQVKIKNNVKSYFQSRKNRTPLLLPIEHFGEVVLRKAIKSTWSNLPLDLDSNSILDEECAKIEKLFPFVKRIGAKKGCFANSSNVWFITPGRDLHGAARATSTGHPINCFLNGILRFGGIIQDGFHYDCTRAGGVHAGQFYNCHGEISSKVGRPHLNIYPNDFIR